MKQLNLPRFNVPDLPPKKLTPRQYHRWLIENRIRLIKDGMLESLRRKADSEFSYTRFVLRD